MKRLSRDHTHFLLNAQNPPVMTLAQDERACVLTERADGMFLSEENPVFRDHAHVMTVRSNPVTGPIFVEDAWPGDVLAVTLHDVTPCDDGSPAYVTYVPSQGLFANPFCPELDFPPVTRWCAVRDGFCCMEVAGKPLRLPAEPFIGTISVAPKEDVIASYAYRKDVVGNIDCRHVTAGCTVFLPVNVPGALLSIGDMHAMMGDGEVMGCAAECRGSVVLSARVYKPGQLPYYDWPQIETDRLIGSIGCVENNLALAVRHCVADLTHRIEHLGGMPFMEAYLLVGQCVKLEICQLTHAPFATALAYVERSVLEAWQ